MEAKALYTSIGRLERRRTGGEGPVIRLGGREYWVDAQELAVWTSLAWRIARRGEIGPQFGRQWRSVDFGTNRTWEQCIDRLLTRGLLVCGTGETEYDALYDLFSALCVIPASGTIWLRIAAFLKLTLRDRVSFSDARRLFCRDERTEGEAYVMQLAGQALLSTAEIIKCVGKGVRRLPDDRSILDAVYDDRDTTCDNLPFTAKYLPGSQQVTLDVANLYLRKQIVLERM